LNWPIAIIALLIGLLTVLKISPSALKATSCASRWVLSESLRRIEMKSTDLEINKKANGLSNYDVN